MSVPSLGQSGSLDVRTVNYIQSALAAWGSTIYWDRFNNSAILSLTFQNSCANKQLRKMKLENPREVQDPSGQVEPYMDYFTRGSAAVETTSSAKANSSCPPSHVAITADTQSKAL